MRHYFNEGKEYLKVKQKQKIMKQNNRDRQREFSYKVVVWSMLLFVAFVLFSSLIRLIFY